MRAPAFSTLLPLPRPAAAPYLVTSTWEAYAAGIRHATTISKELTLQVQSAAQGLTLTLEAGPPALHTTADPQPLAELTQRLAALYTRLEFLLTPTGEVAALLNYAPLRRAGEQLLAELQAAASPNDQVTATLLAFAKRQLASPAAMLHSLQFDYLYQTLLPGRHQPDVARPARQFAGFFDKTPLWFAEQAVVEPATEAGLLPLRLHGPLDAQRTDLFTVQAHQAKALQLAAPSQPPTALPPPHFRYEAEYSLELATGLLQQADLTVYARAGQLLNQEYHLTLKRI